MKKLWSVGFSFLFFLVACSHTPTEKAPEQAMTWKDLFAEQENRARALATLLGKMSVEFEGEGSSVRGLGTCGAALPDSYLLEIRDPVGRLHFRAVSRGEQFEGYFPRLNKLYRDKRSGRLFFTKTWSMPVSFRELSRLSAGLLPDGVTPVKGSELQWNGKHFAGKMVSPGSRSGEILVEVNKDDASLSKVTWNGPAGEVEVSWRDLRPCCKWLGPNANAANAPAKDFSFAHVIDVKTKMSSVAIDWKSLQNWETASAEKFTIQAEPSTKVISLE